MLTTVLVLVLGLCVLALLVRGLAFLLGGVAGLGWGIAQTVREHAEYRQHNPDADAPIVVDPTLRGEAFDRAYQAEFVRRARERNARRIAREEAARAARRGEPRP